MVITSMLPILDWSCCDVFFLSSSLSELALLLEETEDVVENLYGCVKICICTISLEVILEYVVSWTRSNICSLLVDDYVMQIATTEDETL